MTKAEAQKEDYRVRELRPPELERVKSGLGVSDLAVTCEADTGYGPCGTYSDWLDGTCASGHCIMIVEA